MIFFHHSPSLEERHSEKEECYQKKWGVNRELKTGPEACTLPRCSRKTYFHALSVASNAFVLDGADKETVYSEPEKPTRETAST